MVPYSARPLDAEPCLVLPSPRQHVELLVIISSAQTSGRILGMEEHPPFVEENVGAEFDLHWPA